MDAEIPLFPSESAAPLFADAGQALLWLVALGVVVLATLAVLVWRGLARLGQLERRASGLDALTEIGLRLDALAKEREDLDLRRIEHLLIDLRDGQARTEDALLRVVQVPRREEQEPGVLVPQRPGGDLAERVTNRLLAMGYERIVLIGGLESLAELVAQDSEDDGPEEGEVLVEARREGVLHKGRVLVRDGRLAEVELNPAYSLFP